MKNLRETATWIVLLALLAVSASAAVQVASKGLPDEKELEQSELRQWLLARDVTNVSPSKRRELARQLEADFRRGANWPVEVEMLYEDRFKRFEKNFKQLMRAWLLDKVDTWYATRAGSRNAYVDEQIDNILHWRVFFIDEQRGRRSWQLQEVLSQRGNREMREFWFAYFTPEEQQRIRPFLMAVAQLAPARAIHNAQSRWPGAD